MELTSAAKDPESEPSGSPALYRTDRKSWLAQGWVVKMNIPETVLTSTPCATSPPPRNWRPANPPSPWHAGR